MNMKLLVHMVMVLLEWFMYFDLNLQATRTFDYYLY